MQTLRPAIVPLLTLLLLPALACPAAAAPPKPHTVTFGPTRRVPYIPPEAGPADKSEEATTLRVRPLLVDTVQKEWIAGDLHDVTERTFVVRRALHINDALPNEAPRWTWQPGPWLMVDRTTGHIAALHLPDFDPQVSDAVWFRDYAAYCGIASTAKGGLIAIVAELGARKPIVQKWLAPWPPPASQHDAPHPVCARAQWQRTPIRATIQPTGGQPQTFDVLGTSSLIEEGEDPDPTP